MTQDIVECKFIEAEARFQTGDNAGAATAHNDAVIASLAKHDVSDAAWEALNAAETDATITLQKIMMAKYIALFMSSEPFSDWRRTGIPSLVMAVNASANANQIPRIYLYPQDEIDFNGDNILSTDINSSVWWDN